MNGGYVMIDCKGVDLGNLSPVSGLYSKVKDALQTDKPVVLNNVVNGEQSFTPIIAFGGVESETSVFLSFFPVTLHVDNENNITM